MYSEKWWRSWLKTITWRIIGTSALCIVTFLLTGSLAVAGSFAGGMMVLQTILYIIHERLWNNVSLGKSEYTTKGIVVWFTGLSGSGKTTLADAVAENLKLPTKRLDGDIARKTFSSDLGFSREDRTENCRRAAHVASYLKEEYIILASFISPKQEMRDYVRNLVGEDRFIEVFVDCPIGVCFKRDPKGMYSKLKNGCFMGQPFTGMHPDAKYEIPTNPNLIIDSTLPLSECVNETISYIKKRM